MSEDAPQSRSTLEIAEADPARLGAAIRRGIQILNAFKRSDEGVGNALLAERTGLTKPTVSRLTYTLARHGYLSFDPRAREYRLGPKAAAMGIAALAALDVRAQALPRMKRLAKGAAFNVCLGTRDRDWMVYTDVCEGDALIGWRVFPGSRIPMLSSAIGRAYLAGLGKARCAEILDTLGSRTTSKELDDLERSLDTFKDRGFCISVGEWEPEVNGVAAPITLPSGQVFAINLGGPAYKLPVEDLTGILGPRLAKTAQEIEALCRNI